MTQQINLINPDLQPRHDWLAFKSVALATGVAAALVTIFSVYATISAGSALSAQQQASERLAAKQQELEGVQATLAARKGDPALDQEIERLKQEVAARREVLRLAELSAKCCDRVAHVVTLLPRIGNADVVEAALKTCEEIDQLESDADREMRAAMSRLFREQDDVRELIKLKTIYEQLESITDRCEDVANLIEGVVLENS